MELLRRERALVTVSSAMDELTRSANVLDDCKCNLKHEHRRGDVDMT